MAATRSIFQRSSTEPALPCAAHSVLALPKVSRKALEDADNAQKNERRRRSTLQIERFERRPELSAVEEGDETWDPVRTCPANWKPKRYVDALQKKHPKLPVFQDRVMLVELGWLYWSDEVTDEKLSLARLHEKTWRGCIDLASTPCEVKAVDGSDTLFMLEPFPGYRWSTNDVNSRTGDKTAFVFNARSSQERQHWMHAIRQHMEYEIVPPAPSMPVKLEQGTCSICLGDLGDGRSTCETPCKHSFCSECLDQWLAIDSSCPCCRFILCRPPRRPIERRIVDDSKYFWVLWTLLVPGLHCTALASVETSVVCDVKSTGKYGDPTNLGSTHSRKHIMRRAASGQLVNKYASVKV